MTIETGKPLILVIDDETPIRRLLRTALKAHDYDVAESATGEDGLVAAASRPPDLILLDMNLPDMHGTLVLQKLREWYEHPVMVLSVVNDEDTIVKALDLGADDYLTKPFGVPELLARLRVCLRRNRPEASEPVFKSGPLCVDFTKREVTVNGNPVHLTATEFNVLRTFVKNAGKVLTHRHILREVWGPGAARDVQYLRVYMGHLRQKLEPDQDRPQLLITEPGVGYRLMIL